jgi:mono/diheme cytochrome c family protein
MPAGIPESKGNEMKLQCLPLLTCMLMSLPAHMVAQSGGDPEAGRAVYQKSCRPCHGATGQGNPAMVKGSKCALEDLSSKEVQSRTDEQLAKDIAGGTGQKKPIKPLPEKQMKDVIAFVRTMARK